MRQLKISVPTSWDDITLEAYMKFTAIDTDAKEEFIQVKALSYFCGVTELDAIDMKVKDRQAIIAQVTEVLNQEPQFTQAFSLFEKDYGFHPNLDEITFGEFIDLEKHQYNIEDLDKIMAILYRPIKRRMGDRYEIEPYKASTDTSIIRKMSAGTAIAALLFFYRIGTHLSMHILKSLNLEAMEESEETTSSRSGAGLQRSIDFAMETLQELIPSHHYRYIERCSGLLTKATGTNMNEED
jgi:hypothetical protein